MIKRHIREILNFCLSLLGILGTLGCFLTMYPLPISTIFTMFLMICTTSIIFFIYTYRTDTKRILYGLLFIYGLILVVGLPSWKDGFAYLINTMFRVYEENSQYMFERFRVNKDVLNQTYILYVTIWLLFTPMCILIVRTLQRLHSYFLAGFITLPFIFSILLFTLRPDPIYFTMVIMFWLSLVGMGTAAHYKVSNHPATIQTLGILFAISGCVFMLGMQVLFPEKAYIRNPKIESIRLLIQTKLQNMIVDTTSNVIGEMDLRTAGNRYYIGSQQLRIRMKEAQSLYLHGYSGSVYKDNIWSPAKYSDAYDMDSLQVPHPFNFALLEVENLTKVSCEITYLENTQAYLYTPYYLLDDLRDSYVVEKDAYVHRKEVSDYTFSMANVEEESMNLYEPKQYQKDYQAMVERMHLEVPQNLNKTIRELEIPGIQKAVSDKEIIDTVQSFMRSFGTYTLTPGVQPEDEDFIKYFLKDSQKGYCVHYASAAVMIYRFYGIPARFASGYHISKSDFKEGEAIALDYQEHAWVEVLDPVFGWIPVEVTPPSASSITTSPNDMNNPVDNPNDQNQNKPDTPVNEPVVNDTKEEYRYDKVIIGILCIILIGSLLPIRRLLIMKKRKKAMSQSDARLAICACGTYLELLGMDKIPVSIHTIIEEAYYSNHVMTLDTQRIVYTYCEKIRMERKHKTSVWKRLIERYIYAYY